MREVHAGPRSVRVGFDPVAVNPADVRAAIAAATRRDAGDPGSAPAAPPVRLALCGCEACAPDRDWVAARLGGPWPGVLDRFCAAPFDVLAVGFLPGFPYLGPLPAGFELPRLDAPRTRVPAGSVGIGGAHAGIYPFASPGGWRLLGRIAEGLFDPARVPPARFAAGDRIVFAPTLDHGAVHG